MFALLSRTSERPVVAMRIVQVALCALLVVASPIRAQSPIIEPRLPNITETTAEGKRQTVQPDEVGTLEIELYQRFESTNPPDELFALKSWEQGSATALTEIIIRGTEAELRFYPDDCAIRYFHRKMKPEELEELRRFVRDKKVDRLPDYTPDIHDGVQYGYVHLTKEGGYRLWMNNPPDSEELKELQSGQRNRVYGELVQLFERIGSPDRLSIRYLKNKWLAGLEVIYAHPRNQVLAAWANGDDIRVLVDDCSEMPPQWRSLRGGALGPNVEQPKAFPPDAFCDSAFGLRDVRDDCQPWQVRWGNKSIRGGRLEWSTPPATWICEPGQKPIRLFDRLIRHQLVTPDGHWVVGILADKLICFDLLARKMVPIDNPETVDKFYALDYLPDQKRVLLVRPWREGPRNPGPNYEPHAEYRLLDPATGRTQEVKADHHDAKHLWQRTDRPFQATQQPGVVWVAFAVPNSHSMLGRFDMGSLRFRQWIPIDTLQVDSDHVWVDEPALRIYVVYRGHLLRLPLPREVFDDRKD